MTQPEAVPMLSGAVVDTREQPTVMRIGVVTVIGPGTNLTVRISGSNVLIDAAYLTTYQPVLGDLVSVVRQGAAWLCLGTYALFPSDHLLMNPSFEDGPAGSPLVPVDWTLYHDPASTATAVSEVTLNKASRDGSQFWDIILVATGTSFDTLASEPIPVAAEQIWTAAAWSNGARTAVGVTANAVLQLGWYANAGDPIPGFITTVDVNNRNATTIGAINYYEWTLLRQGADATGYSPPPGANFVRVLLHNILTNTVGNAVVNVWDAISIRRVA